MELTIHDIDWIGKFSNREKAFIVSYAKTGDLENSLIEAGYSETVLDWMGDKLLSQKPIRDQLAALKEQGEREQDEVKVREVVQGFRNIAEANILDFYDEEGQVVDVTAMDPSKTHAIKEIKRTINPKTGAVTVTVTMHDKIAALQNLGRIGGHYAADNGQSGGDVNIQINLPGGLGNI